MVALRQDRRRSVRRFDHSGHRTHVAAQVDLAAEPERPRGKPRRLSIADRFAVAAAREAVARSAIDVGGCERRTGVYFGSSTGGMLEAETYIEALLAPRPAGEAARAEPPRRGAAQLSRRCGGPRPGDRRTRANRLHRVRVGRHGDRRRHSRHPSWGGGRRDRRRFRLPLSADLRGVQCAALGGRAILPAVSRGPRRAVARRGRSRARSGAPRAGRGARRAAARPRAGRAASCDAHHMTAPHPRGWAPRSDPRALADARSILRDRLRERPRHRYAAERRGGVRGPRRGLRLPSAGSSGDLHQVSRRPPAGIGRGAGGRGDDPLPAPWEVHQCRTTARPIPDPASAGPGASPAPCASAHALSTSLAFGGANAALVFTRHGDQDPAR